MAGLATQNLKCEWVAEENGGGCGSDNVLRRPEGPGWPEVLVAGSSGLPQGPVAGSSEWRRKFRVSGNWG